MQYILNGQPLRCAFVNVNYYERIFKYNPICIPLDLNAYYKCMFKH